MMTQERRKSEANYDGYDGYESSQGWNEKDFGRFDAQQAAYYLSELKACCIDTSAALHILDIGFGNGSFLGWCRDRGWECNGIELNDRLVTRAQGQGYTVAGEIEALPNLQKGEGFDLITAFDVLEHIDRQALVPFLKSVAAVCRPKTVVVLRFPNGDNPFSMPLQNGDVTHKTAIGQAMLRQVAALAGFEVVALRSPNHSAARLSFARHLALAAGKPARWLAGTAIRHLFMGGAPVHFSSNLLAVLRYGRPT